MTAASQMVNAASLNLLFMQIVFKALTDSKSQSTDPPDHEAAFYRIEQLGFQVGQRLVERILLNAQTPRLVDPIECVKFLCKEFWMIVFGKGIDNLKTNHRGVYVLHDHTFQWISRFAIDANASETAKMAVLVKTTLIRIFANLSFISSTWHFLVDC